MDELKTDEEEIREYLVAIDAMVDKMIMFGFTIKTLFQDKTPEQVAEFFGISVDLSTETLKIIRSIPDASAPR